MKKLAVLILACLFAVPAMAQEKYTVPALTDLQKYNTAAWQWNGAYVILIKYAKSLGQTVEEAATAAGKMAAATWDRDMTFDDLVNSILYIYTVMTPSGKVEITEQSSEMVIFTVPDFYKPLDQMLEEYQVTRDELSEFYAIYARQIVNLIGATYTVEDTGTVIKISISKN